MPPDPREQHTLTRVLTRFLFAFGGLTADATPMLDVALFDLETHTWSVTAPSPVSPVCIRACAPWLASPCLAFAWLWLGLALPCLTQATMRRR